MAEQKQQTNAFRELLNKYQVSQIVRPQHNVVIVNTDETPVQAFQKIVQHNVLSAPAYDKKTNHFIGFLDTRDLVQFVVFQTEEKDRDAKRANMLAPPPVDLVSIFDSATRMYSHPMQGITISYMAKRNRFVPVHMNDSLLKVAELLSQNDLHRVPVVDEHGHILDIISQSTLVAFLYEHKDAVHDELEVKMSNIRIGSSPVFAVRETASALETFKIMSKYNRTGIAIVDDNERFIGNTSGSDLKLFIQNPEQNSALLNLPIVEFLSTIRRAEIVEKTRSPTITVRSDDTVGRVLGKLYATRIHRVFIAEDENGYKPQVVISLTDVLSYLLHANMHQPVVVDHA